MGFETEFMIPHHRRSFQITRENPFNPMGTLNTAVLDFDAAPVLKWGTPYQLGLTSAPAPSQSGGWCDVINSTTLGTTFKFLRAGMYEIHVSLALPGTEETFPQVGMATILDASSASMVVATPILPTTLNAFGAPGVIDWKSDQQKEQAIGMSLCGSVAITKAQAGGALPANVAGATGVGCVRLHINNNAGGGFSPIGMICSLWCNQTNSLAG